jgi:DNA-binding transcriptional MerR regulator
MSKLVKRKDICKMLGISPSKVNFYTTQGLFPLEGRTKGGYGLYNSDKIRSRFLRITELKEERLTIAEIRERILAEEKEKGQFLELKFEN